MLQRLLLLGGNGALGKSFVKQFKNAKTSQWKVLSIDLNENSEADANVLIRPDVPLKDQMAEIKAGIGKVSQEYEAVITVAGGFAFGYVKDLEVFDQYELMKKVNMDTALLAAHLSTQYLSSSGLLVFTGAAKVFEAPVPELAAYALSKHATHALASSMSATVGNELPEDSRVITILPTMIDTPANRDAMPDMDKKNWIPTEDIAGLVKMWASGVSTPENGSFVKLDYESGSVTTKFL
jgi:dihydropteridine reductase